MKKIIYILVLFCGLLAFNNNVKAEEYTCSYLKGDSETLSFSFNDNTISFEYDLSSSSTVSSVLDFVVDDRYSKYINKKTVGNNIEYEISDNSKVNEILINDVLMGKCARNVYVCQSSPIIGEFNTTYGVLFSTQHVSDIENLDSGYTFFEDIEGLSEEHFMFPGTNCTLLDIDESNSTGEIVDVYDTECDYYNSFIIRDEQGNIAGNLYNKYKGCADDSQCLTEYNTEKENLRSFCSSVLKTGDYKLDPCVESCLNFTSDIQDIEGINVSSGKCSLSDRIVNWIANIMKWIKYIAPVLVIIFGIMDFIKAIASNSDDAMKKAQGRFIKRIIVAALVFLVPFVIEFALNTFNLVSDNPYCNILGG